MRKALIVWGGWQGHYPREMADLFSRMLTQEGFDVYVSDTLDAFLDPQLAEYNLIVPVWTMGKISGEQCRAACSAVIAGTGIAGCHGGMCDAFRDNTDWQFMTGGQWVAHPGNDGTRHTIYITDPAHPIMAGVKDFEVSTEMYYMHVDPAVKVLAVCHFPLADGPHVPNGHVTMPVVWTKYFGAGRVFYCSLGHKPEVIEMEPVRTIMRRGFVWAART